VAGGVEEAERGQGLNVLQHGASGVDICLRGIRQGDREVRVPAEKAGEAPTGEEE